MKYFNSSDNPSAAPRTVTFTANDAGANNTGSATQIIHVASTTVTNTNDSGAGSLRQAILNANHGRSDTISFNIAGGGVQTIKLLSALPTITDAVIIDGTTQTGFAGAPLIELNGAGAGAGANGLKITAGGSTVRGLVINRFAAAGIELRGGGSNVIEGNLSRHRTRRATRTWATRPRACIVIGSDNNTIGGTTAAAAERDLRQRVYGVQLVGRRRQQRAVGTASASTPRAPRPWPMASVGVDVRQTQQHDRRLGQRRRQRDLAATACTACG